MIRRCDPLLSIKLLLNKSSNSALNSVPPSVITSAQLPDLHKTFSKNTCRDGCGLSWYRRDVHELGEVFDHHHDVFVARLTDWVEGPGKVHPPAEKDTLYG